MSPSRPPSMTTGSPSTALSSRPGTASTLDLSDGGRMGVENILQIWAILFYASRGSKATHCRHDSHLGHVAAKAHFLQRQSVFGARNASRVLIQQPAPLESPAPKIEMRSPFSGRCTMPRTRGGCAFLTRIKETPMGFPTATTRAARPSRSYCATTRRGERVPHPRRWGARRAVVG